METAGKKTDGIYIVKRIGYWLAQDSKLDGI